LPADLPFPFPFFIQFNADDAFRFLRFALFAQFNADGAFRFLPVSRRLPKLTQFEQRRPGSVPRRSALFASLDAFFIRFSIQGTLI